jgi:hypothetical protein
MSNGLAGSPSIRFLVLIVAAWLAAAPAQAQLGSPSPQHLATAGGAVDALRGSTTTAPKDELSLPSSAGCGGATGAALFGATAVCPARAVLPPAGPFAAHCNSACRTYRRGLLLCVTCCSCCFFDYSDPICACSSDCIEI